MCGEQNSMSFKLEFRAAADESVYADFEPFPELQGYEGQMHGGIICSLLDSAMVHCLFHKGVEAVTAELTVKYAKLVPYDSPIRVRAWVTEKILTLYRVKSELSVNGEILASAESKFMGMRK
jgi:acyl-coenzyme A thioesterase PaaI-like protein